MSKEIVSQDVIHEMDVFEFEQRKAKALIAGSILPQHYKNIGDVIILNEMSRNLKIPTVMLAQQLYVVKGKPTMSGQLVIAVLNGSGRFDSVIKWEEQEQPKWRVRAYAEIDGDRLYGDWLDDDVIKANGWESNPKWRTMKSQMAKYRTASWFARLYAPDVLMGFHESEEIRDAVEIKEQPQGEMQNIMSELTGKNDAVDAEVEEVKE